MNKSDTEIKLQYMADIFHGMAYKDMDKRHTDIYKQEEFRKIDKVVAGLKEEVRDD